MIMTSFWSYAKHFALRYWLWYVFGIVALALTTSISLWLPQLTKEVVNTLGEGANFRVSHAMGSGRDSSVGHVPLLIVALGATLILVRSLSRILIFWPGQKIASDTRSWMVRQFIRMRQSELMKSGLGDLISRMSNDVTHLRLLCGFGLLQLMNMIFMMGFALVLMFRTDSELTLLALAPISGLLVVTYIGMPFMTRYSREQQEVMGILTNRVTESFHNVQTIQTHVAYEAFEKRIDDANQKILKSSLKLMVVRTLTFPFMILFTGLAEVLVVLYGGFKVVNGEMTVGDILAFNIYVGILSWPLAAVGIIVSMIQRASTALARVADVEKSLKENFEIGPEIKSLSENPENRGGPDCRVREKGTQRRAPTMSFEGFRIGSKETVLPLSGESHSGFSKSSLLDAGEFSERWVLELRDLSFEYPTRLGTSALQGINLKLGKSERLGIFGPVGAGKTTLFSLLTRIYEPAPGTIFFKGRDLATLSPLDVRRQIRLVSQTVHLFSDTIRANLNFGLEHALDDSRLEEVCRAASIWQDISSFPLGLSTEIGERGVRLSGGQKQRLALARMLLRPGELFLFDDVMSAVDTNTELQLLETLFSLGIPFMVTSHRESTLAKCDRVLFLRDGVAEYLGPFDGFKQQYDLQAEVTAKNDD